MARATIARTGGRGMTPLEQHAALVHVLNAADRDEVGGVTPPEYTAARPLDDLGDDDLVRQAETARAWRWAAELADWLAVGICGYPDAAALMADVLAERYAGPADGLAVALALPAWCEAEWLARVTWPELYEDRPDVRPPRTAAEAAAHGLSVRRPRRRRQRLRTPTLPGCQGGFLTSADHVCHSLRVRGHEMCPACEQEFAARLAKTA